MKTLIEALWIVTTLLQGCSTKNERRAPTLLPRRHAKDAVEEELGMPVQAGQGTDGDVWAVYQQRVYAIPATGVSGKQIACLARTLGLCEIVAFPAALMAKMMRFALSSVYRLTPPGNPE